MLKVTEVSRKSGANERKAEIYFSAFYFYFVQFYVFVALLTKFLSCHFRLKVNLYSRTNGPPWSPWCSSCCCRIMWTTRKISRENFPIRLLISFLYFREWQDLFYAVHSVCLWDEKGAQKIRDSLEELIVGFIKQAQSRVLVAGEEQALLKAYIVEWRKFFTQSSFLPLPFWQLENSLQVSSMTFDPGNPLQFKNVFYFSRKLRQVTTQITAPPRNLPTPTTV